MWMVSMGDVYWVNYHFFVNHFLKKKHFFIVKCVFQTKIYHFHKFNNNNNNNTSNV
jgi:hypothetical protein